MSFVYDQKVVDSMYGSHVVSMAVDYGVDLVKMWPLQTNQELENDVKYAENLQVMFSGMMTQVLLKRSEEVDQSVAEAVYEGMDVLPGVDPNRKGNPRPHGEPLTHYAQRLRIRSRR